MTKKEKKHKDKDKDKDKDKGKAKSSSKQQLPEPLETQRHYVICGPDQNSHVSVGSVGWTMGRSRGWKQLCLCVCSQMGVADGRVSAGCSVRVIGRAGVQWM